MATIKSFSDLEQSRKLAEILPLESADMFYMFESITGELRYHPIIITEQANRNFIISEHNSGKGVVSWSLAKLLDILPKIHGVKPILDLEECAIEYSGIELYTTASNPVDACVATIIKLHELKRL